MKKSTRIPAILLSGAKSTIDTSTLPKKDWEVHSGRAPVAGEDVHSLRSQKIAGTRNIVLEAESGKQLSVTLGEAEVFASNFLKDQGYTVTPPAAA